MIKINPSILSKTVKAITPKIEKVEEAQIRGTIVFRNQEHFVQLDGAPSNALTPIANFAEGASDAGFVHGDRVLVLIKNHQAIVTKNLTTGLQAQAAKEASTFTTAITDEGITAQRIIANDTFTNTLRANNITADEIIAGMATIDTLDANYAHITNGVIDNAKIGYADVNDLSANYAHITQGVIDNAKIDIADVNNLSANYAHITNGVIDNAKIGYADVNDLSANYAHITNGVIDNAKIGYADVDDLNAHYAAIDMANVNNAWIENGAIKKAEVFDENVFDLSGNRATLSRIDASKINVANLRADNLVVRRINGQPVVGGYTLISNTSPDYEHKNPQALGWYEFVNAQWVLSTDTTVDMTKAYYQEGDEVSLYDQTYIDGLENDLQQQIDGAVETYTGSVVPTLVNWPYTDWYDTSVTPIHDERAKHVGDIYYVVNSAADENGYCYRFAYDNTTHAYSWVLIKDSDVTKALSDISELQTFESETTSWIEETDEGLETIRTNYTALSGRVDDVEDTANAALPATTFETFESTTFTDLVDEVDEQSTTMTNMTTRLGLNADGTQSATDIVSKESALEQTVDGISTMVGKTEAHLIGMYATSSTAEGTAAKVATITPAIPSGTNWELSTGTTVTVKFTNANTTASPTLNVNSKGAKAIKTYANGNLSEAEYKWKAGSTFTFTYNGTNWLMQDSTASVRMSSAETSITQNADAIKLEAVSREMAVNLLLDSDVLDLAKVNAPANRYFSDAAVTQVTCSSFELTDSPEQGIKYGRRFVCDGTNTSTVGRGYAFYNSNTNDIPYSVNTTYTATWWARCTDGSGKTRIAYPGGGTATGVCDLITLTSTWKKCTATFTTKSALNTNYNRLWFHAIFSANTAGTVEICGCKLVAGDAVEQYKTTIEQTSNNVLIQATKNDTTASQGGQHLIQSLINVAPSGITIDAAKVNINGTTVFSDGTSIQSRIDAVEVGGRNLHKDSANLGSSWTLNNATLSNDVATITRTSSTTGEYRIYQMPANGYWSWEPNTEYVVSIEAKGNAGGEELQFLCNGGGTPTYHDANPKLTTSWKRYSRSFKTGSSVSTGSMTYAYGGTGAGSIQLRNPKLEKGTKATDWTPAPEDVQAEIDAKKSVHTLNTSYSYTYANILTYSAEGFNSDWNVTSTDGVKAGDTARLKVTVSNMSNAPVYIIGTVTEVKSATKINMTSHGLDTTIIDGGNILTNSIGANQIKANAITANKIAIGDYNNYVTVTENDASSILPNSGIEIRDGWLYKASASASNAWVSPVLNNWTKAGEKYRVTGIFKTEVAGKVFVYIYGRNADGSAVSGAGTITITTTANVEKAMSETITITEAVANCPKVNINVYFRNSSDASVVGYVRRLRVERMSGGELIVDGAVTVGSMSQDAQNKVLNSNIEVGGRNLLGATDNTFLPNGSNVGASMTFGSIGRYNSPDSEFSKESYDGSSNSLIVTSTETGNRGVGWYTKKGEVKAGETYTFSCRVKANVATTVHTHTAWRNGSATAGYTGWTAGGNMSISANTWTDYSYTFTPSSSAQLSWEFYVALCFTGATTGVTCRIAHAMLEKGNKATDWSPASGDETGTNLISYPYFRDAWSGSPYTVAGVTYTLNKDGTVTAKGTATANAWYSFSLSHYPYAPNGAFGLPAGTYTLSGCPSGGSSTTYRINFAAYSVDDGTTSLGNSVADYGNGATVTLTQPALVRIEALICNGYACPSAGITFKPMLEVGGVAHTFASPTASKAAAEGATNYLHADSNGLRIASADPRTQNQRIQMTSSNIDMYDSGGVKRININSNSGVTVGRSDKGHTVVNDVGLYIYDNSNNKSAQATSAGFEVFDTADNSSAALFGGTSRIGKASGARAVTTSTGLDIYNSSNQKKASYGSTQYIYGGSGTYPLVSVDGTNARLMQSANNYANVNSSGLQIYQSGASVAEFGSSARVGQTSSNNIEISSTAFEVVDADGSTQFSITPATSSTSRTEYHSIGTFSSGATKKFSISKSATAFRIDVYPSSGSSTVGSVSIPASTAGATTSATVGVATITLKRVTAGGRIEATVKANSAIRGGRYSVTSPRRVANITAGGYDLCYTAGDSISGYIWKGASYVTNSKQVIDLTLPINKPILAENVTVSDVQMITRQGNAYTHGSSASSFVAWTVDNYSIEEAGILVAVSRTTTTNATNNSPIGVYLICNIKFS